MTAAIIVASGSSRRMGFDKLMAPLAGSSVLAHSVAAFASHAEISHVVVVTDQKRFAALDLTTAAIPVVRAEGGAERQDSVASGLALLPAECSLVAIHDGARPLISAEAISLALDAAAVHGAASLAHPVTETLKRADGDDFVQEAVSRDSLWAMETPQCFRLRLLQAAYEQVRSDGLHITDEVSALQHLGHAVKLIPNPGPNPKITYPGDLTLAAKLLAPSL
ncbi:2-C-methyl-D-erythritol 4-phosphate cytidylyltransferase [Roseibacillus ishigakijimensis]|uniref:2-C-methyl-D-erythritol 4-phosphate cytidylyltransferase n=1 Tax=Roseibacillus ishigakijimensis TaxID=454146 RepID=A0A934RPH7_9BACT|nr:2-C-methyl-D-erythritol 4-phosphate cytidylyltransferase [Roseibacillus ishigakijimensis]MBK1835124.1 2-C-methyl-D-erythritol 4-phosphate cytidylyltransferase [Roseibacillus ishigakijimensis]